MEVVGTMFFKDRKLLIDKPRKRNTYQMIGGRVEEGETPLEAAIDEYNDNLTNDNVIGYIDANGNLHAIVTIYFCAGRGQELQDIVIK